MQLKQNSTPLATTGQYTYDVQNRLISAESANKKLEFSYDYQGRRFSKKTYTGSPGNWVLSNEQKFVYDGYQQIAEFNGSDTLQRSYTWLGDSPGWVRDYIVAGGNPPEAATLFYVIDGNKNVRALIDSSGNVVAEYDYNPFGKITSQGGTYANANKYRFSSEYHDDETGLVYFNFRYYSPSLQRWLNRDPIEENDNPNLYVFTANNPVNKWDVLGMWGSDVHNDMTRDWAASINYPSVAANAIGAANEAVDHGGVGPMPWGDQSYHFNRPWSDAGDSRKRHSAEHLKNAKASCSDNASLMAVVDKPEIAVANLGLSLHPLQDYYAHGDFGRYTKGNIYTWHNAGSPQRLSLFDNPANYPDDPGLDSYGSDGRPAGQFQGKNVVQYTWVTGEYARFKPGSQRITATQRETLRVLKEFQRHLKKQKKCCECLKYFGILK